MPTAFLNSLRTYLYATSDNARVCESDPAAQRVAVSMPRTSSTTCVLEINDVDEGVAALQKRSLARRAEFRGRLCRGALRLASEPVINPAGWP